MKRMQSLVLIFALLFNLILPSIASATNAGSETNDLVEQEVGEILKNNQLTESESAGEFSDMWEEGLKPVYWDLRNWSNSGGEDPKASIIQNGGESLVQIELDQTVGFFQYQDKIQVDGKRNYNFHAKVKTEDIHTPHSSHHAVSLRVEQFDHEDELVKREDIAFVNNHEGESEWTDLSKTIETDKQTTEVRVILVLGHVSAGSGSTGTIWIDSLSVTGESVALKDIVLTPESLVISKGAEENLTHTLEPVNTTNKEMVWFSSNDDIVTINEGKVVGIEAGKATITVQSKEEPTIKATSEIEVVEGDVLVTDITLDQEDITLAEGKGTILAPSIRPANANQEVIWSTSNEGVAAVEAGVITAISPGVSTITATSFDGNVSATTEVTIEAYEDDVFDQLREKWLQNVVPNDYIDLNHTVMKSYVEDISNDAQALWDSMDTDKDRTYLWENAASTTVSADVTTNYRNLSTLAQAYAIKGSELEGNTQLLKDIINGLDWMDEHRYNGDGHDYDNWWDWQIGVPQLLNEVVVIVYDYLTEDQISHYMKAIQKHVPDPTKYHGINYSWEITATGANLVDLIKAVSVQGIISKDETRIEKGKKHVPVVEIKKSGKGNGLYADGSFVDHSNIAYTGTYGVVFLGSMFDMVYLLEGSPYALDKEELNNIYDMILNAFQPVIYRGLMMDMVNGRAISREGPQDIGHGRGAIERIIQYIEFAPEAYKTELESMVKYWMLSNEDLQEHFGRIPVIATANRIMDDDQIQAKDELITHNNFANMDRVVHRRPGYAFGISMYSDRIGAYEGNMNGENLRAHYTASGMTYLYTNDLTQYNDGYWPTVDSYRLPGVTVDATKQLAPGEGTAKNSPQSWVGGSTMDDLYGINGMFLDQSIYGMTLQGKKSWFMFDDEIVALGSDINSEDGRNIETIVENRKLTNSGTNNLYVNGEKMSSELGMKEKTDSVEWAHLSGNVEDSDIGYYFPTNENVSFEREARSGAWKDINIDGSSDLLTRNYLSMSIDHGVNPEKGNYAYVLLPNQSKEATATYAKNADIEILENNDKVQAVKENNLHIVGANFWENEETTVDKITSYNKASVMVKEIPGDRLEVSVSDPTHKNKDVIEIELDYAIKSPLWLDSRVSILESTATKTKIAVHVEGAMGQSIKGTFNLSEDAAGWENEVIYSEDFEGKENEDLADWKLIGKGTATKHAISEKLYATKDFSAKHTFEPVDEKVMITYDFVPLSENIDTAMTLGAEGQAIQTYGDMPIIVRAVDEKFDAYNGKGYEAKNDLTWEENKTYHIRIEVDVDNQSYNAFVTPKGEKEVQIAQDYQYRSSADTPDNISQFVMKENAVEKGSFISNFKVNGESIGNVNHVMKVKSDDGKLFTATKDFEPQPNRSIIEWSFMKEDLQESSFKLEGTNESIHLEVKDNQLIDRNSEKVIISQIEAEVWYTLKVDLNAVTGDYDVYVNGEVVEKNLSWNTSEVSPASDPALGSMTIGTTGELFVDDISIVKTSLVAESIAIDSDIQQVNIGEELTLQAKVTPSNAFISGLRWSSSDESVANVNRDGVLTGVKEGDVVVTAHDTITGLSATINIEVLPVSEVEVDLSVLTKLIDRAQKKVEEAKIGDKPGEWTQSSVDNLQATIAKAVDLQHDETATQKETNDMVKTLEKALQVFEDAVNVQAKDEEDTDTEDNKDNDINQNTENDGKDNDKEKEIAEKEDEGNQLPHTATNTYNVLFLGIVLLVLGVLFTIFRRKKI